MNQFQHYANIREKRAALAAEFPTGDTFVVALTGKHSPVTEVTLDIAAKLLAEGDFRLATPEEVTAFKRNQELTRAISTGIGVDAARAMFGITPKGK